MLYDFDLPKLIRRYLPVWFRKPRALSFGYALLSHLEVIHGLFLSVRDAIIAQYRYNGLIHSMERAINDQFDPVLRRVFITVVDQQPVLYYQDWSEPAFYHYDDEGGLAGYHYYDESQLNVVYTYDHEFVIHIPIDLGMEQPLILELVELYRYAGRRPKFEYQ